MTVQIYVSISWFDEKSGVVFTLFDGYHEVQNGI